MLPCRGQPEVLRHRFPHGVLRGAQGCPEGRLRDGPGLQQAGHQLHLQPRGHHHHLPLGPGGGLGKVPGQRRRRQDCL